MKTKKILAAALALSMLFAASCGKNEESEKDKTSSKADSTSVSDTTEATSENGDSSSDSENSDTESSSSGSDVDPDAPEEPASEEELAEVNELIEQYKKAVTDKDFATLAKITDADMLQYISEGKEATADELEALLSGENGDGENVAYIGMEVSEYEFGEAECHNSTASIFNDFLSDEAISALAEEAGTAVDAAEKYTIDGVYTFKLNSKSSTGDGDESGEDASFSSDVSMEMFVFRINGEWKIDCGYGMVVSMYNTFSNMDTDDLDADLDAEDSEDLSDDLD